MMQAQVATIFAVLAILGFLVQVWRLPSGPGCPRCGLPLRGGRAKPKHWLARTVLPGAQAQCPACGWNGRTRREPPELAAVRGRRGGAR